MHRLRASLVVTAIAAAAALLVLGASVPAFAQDTDASEQQAPRVFLDQLFLPKVGLSDEEILLQLQDLATDSRYSFSFGLSYTFGSIFNNVVNPRF